MDIRAYAKEHNKTLSEMAAAAGVPLTTFHGYATGRRSVPLRVIIKIEDATEGAVLARDWCAELNRESRT